MGFKLPMLETDVDCEPLGYAGLVFTFWLNATNPAEEWEAPDDPQEWDRLWYVSYARALLHITIPAKFSDSGEEEILEIPDARAVWDLEHAPGFDRHILIWALNQVAEQRQQRLEIAAKN